MQKSIATITPSELGELQRAGRPIELIDVRTPAEYREVHASVARSIPLDRLDPGKVVEDRTPEADQPIYLICRSGGRSRQAAEKFLAAGFTNVASVEGGTSAWEQAGLPVVRGRKTISLERQVRIAAGALVLLGTILGAYVHPAFLGLSAFVGAGLLFAGVTDTCGMALLLGRMPWNQAGDGATSCRM